MLSKITADELKRFFSKHGLVTDVKLMYGPNGTFRHFAFVGFKTAKEAENAVIGMNSTVLGDSRIRVELCKSVHSMFYQITPGPDNRNTVEAGDVTWRSANFIKDKEPLKKEPNLTNNLTKAQQVFYNAVKEIEQTGRIFVRNLPYSCTDKNIRNKFKAFGPLTAAFLPIDEKTGLNKGFAFVSFKSPSHAVEAYKQLNGSIFQGRVIHLIPGKKINSKEAKGDDDDDDEDGDDNDNEHSDGEVDFKHSKPG